MCARVCLWVCFCPFARWRRCRLLRGVPVVGHVALASAAVAVVVVAGSIRLLDLAAAAAHSAAAAPSPVAVAVAAVVADTVPQRNEKKRFTQ